MSRPSTLNEKEIELGKAMREDGNTWQSIADELHVSRDTAMYHCSSFRKTQVQRAVKKYHQNNYKKVRAKQREYAYNTKIQ
jgi:orotate phosphoribosyltransferase-like protein